MDQTNVTPSAQLLALALRRRLRVRFRVDELTNSTVHLQLRDGAETLEWAVSTELDSLPGAVDRLAVAALRHCGHIA